MIDVPEDRNLTQQERIARTHLDHAISLHLEGNKEGALKSMRRALALDPNLVQEKLTRNLMQELTGLPAQEAFDLLSHQSSSKTLMKSAREAERQVTPPKAPGVSFYALITLTAVLAGMVVYGIVSGRFGPALQRFHLLQMELNKHTLGGYEYYLVVPNGAAPEGGWPVVVAFHGLNSEGRQVMWLAEQFTNAGAIFIAPTFGGYEPYPGEGPVGEMSRILAEVGAKYPLQSRGAVLLGFSQGGSFAFRFSIRHPEQVYAVVTAGAPEYDQIFPAKDNTPYYFTWGQLDGLQDFVIPWHVQPLANAGYNIRTYVIPGYGHEVTPFAIEQTLSLIE